MNQLLLQLRDKGNTVLVVEHEPDVIAIADHVVDLGPGAGADGGTVCFEGTVERAAGQRHADRSPPRVPGRAQAGHPHARGHPGDPPRCPEQPAGRERGRPARRAVRGDRRRGIGQELADPRLDAGWTRASSRSTRRRSGARRAATRRRTPACWTRSGRPSPRRTASSPRCSARTPRAPARAATATASSTRPWA